MRYCLPHAAWLKVQGEKGVRTPSRLAPELDTLRDSSTFASGHHTFDLFLTYCIYLEVSGPLAHPQFHNNRDPKYARLLELIHSLALSGVTSGCLDSDVGSRTGGGKPHIRRQICPMNLVSDQTLNPRKIRSAKGRP